MLLLMVLLILMRVLLHEVLLQIRPYMLRLHELCGGRVARPLVVNESLKRGDRSDCQCARKYAAPKGRPLKKLNLEGNIT